MSMDFNIVKMDKFRVVGYVISTTNEGGQCRQDIPLFWSDVIQNNKLEDLFALSDSEIPKVMGINSYNTDQSNGRKFHYYIACASKKSVPEGMTEFMVPAATWAVFPCKREEIASVEIRIVNEWLPQSDYMLVNKGYETGDMISEAPDIEIHGQDGNSEVWVAGVPCSEYIRNRRLSKAAMELQTGNEKVIDVAIKYGYSSPNSFNRAFKIFHGVAPSSLKKEGVTVKAYPPLFFNLEIKGAHTLEYRLVQKDAFRIVGIKIHTTMENGTCYRDIPLAWNGFLLKNANNHVIFSLQKLFKNVTISAYCIFPRMEE